MFCCFQCIGVNIYNYVYVLYLVLQRVDRLIQVNICTVPLLDFVTCYDNTKIFSFKYTHNISQQIARNIGATHLIYINYTFLKI